jgi:putative ABC transport system substrate-binding protein
MISGDTPNFMNPVPNFQFGTPMGELEKLKLILKLKPSSSRIAASVCLIEELRRQTMAKPFNLNLGILFVLITCLVFSGCPSAPEKPKMVKVGFLNLTPTLDNIITTFKQGMTDLGYVENQNIQYIYDGPLGKMASVKPAAEKLVDQEVDLIFTFTTALVTKAQEAVAARGSDTPIVFSLVLDPVRNGFANSLREPGKNLTGLISSGFAEGGLEWLSKIVPDLKRLYVPFKPDDQSMSILIKELKTEADKRGIELVIAGINTEAEVLTVIENIPSDVQAVWEIASTFWGPYVDKFTQSALAHKKPLMGAASTWAEAGALISYGHNNAAMGRQAARLAHKILKGTPAGHLPIERSELSMTINIRTADGIGLAIPDEILKQADGIYR